ncbi:unnamed protein product [Hapterophycus canaliculatus]
MNDGGGEGWPLTAPIVVFTFFDPVDSVNHRNVGGLMPVFKDDFVKTYQVLRIMFGACGQQAFWCCSLDRRLVDHQAFVLAGRSPGRSLLLRRGPPSLVSA